jgi:hypothetical protein
VKTAYNKTKKNKKFFSIAGRLCLIWVLEVWILRPPDLWDCINVLHERKISVLPRFYLGGVSTY